MNAYTIVTNNSRITPDSHAGFDCRSVPGGLGEIYDAVSLMLQNGYRLISSPLPANVPLIRSPVRSVVLLRRSKRYDEEGLLMLEKARERTSTLGVNNDSRVRADLEMIDADQLARTLAQLEDSHA